MTKWSLVSGRWCKQEVGWEMWRKNFLDISALWQTSVVRFVADNITMYGMPWEKFRVIWMALFWTVSIRVRRRLCRTFSTDFGIFRRRYNGVVIYIFNSDFKFFDDASEFSVTSLYIVFIFSSKFIGTYRISGSGWPDIRPFFCYPVPVPAKILPVTG